MRTTMRERDEVIHRLGKLGIGHEQANQLRRIAMTLRNWFEMECGTEGHNGSTISIERDENGEGRPFKRVRYATASTGYVDNRWPVPDMEAGARKRLGAIMAKLPGLVYYVQGDCRGAALYILRDKDVGKGETLDSIYTRGIAIY